MSEFIRGADSRYMRTLDKRRDEQQAKDAARLEPKRHWSGYRVSIIPCHGHPTLPAERELRRVVHTALHGFFHDISTRVTARLPEAVRVTFDQLLGVGPEEAVSRFEQLKTPPAAPTIAHLQQEITKLQTLRALGVPAEVVHSM